MQAVKLVTIALVGLISFSEAKHVQAPNLIKDSVLLTAQEHRSFINVASDQILRRNAHDDWQIQMEVDKNATKAIPELAAELRLSTLANRISKAQLRKDLEEKGPFTLFGPTDAAFRALPHWAKKAIKDVKVLAKFLKFHVLKREIWSETLENELLAETLLGSKLRVNIYKNGKKVFATAQCAPINLTRVDNNATNGVIHVLNSVILPPNGNAVTVLSAHKELSLLVQAVSDAGLVSTLSGDGPFTIFAPTDDAFAKLPPGTLHKLMKNPLVLAKILKYHLVAGTYCSHGLESGDVATVEGQKVTVKVSADGVTVNNARVIVPDGSITNGVVHVIDTVLLPPAFFL